MKKKNWPKRIYCKREQKEILFNALMSRYLGNQYRDRWVENPAFIYTISRHFGLTRNCYLLEVTAPKGVIHRQYFDELPEGIEYKPRR